MLKKRLNKTYRRTKYVFYKETEFNLQENISSFTGAFLGIGLIAYIQSTLLDHVENFFLIGSFGASSVLIFGAVHSPLSQPRNLIGGHLISAVIGVTVYKLIPDPIWISAPLSVATSIVAMQFTRTLHPPGGATALIAVIGTEKIKALGYFFVISPILSGSLILLCFSLLFNNIPNIRKYPSSLRKPRIFSLRIPK